MNLRKRKDDFPRHPRASQIAQGATINLEAGERKDIKGTPHRPGWEKSLANGGRN